MKEFCQIPLSRIDVPNQFVRDRNGTFHKDQRHLVESVRLVGLRFPILVKAHGARFTLVDGFRRMKAMESIKGESITAHVVPESDKMSVELLRFQSNFHREDLKPIDEAKLIRSLCSEEGMSINEASKIVGKKPTTIRRYFDCLKINAKWQKLVNDRVVSLFDIQSVAALTVKGQKKLYEDIKRKGIPFSLDVIRSGTWSMDPIKHPEWFNVPKAVAAHRIEINQTPVQFRRIDSVAKMKAVTDHRKGVLRRYEDEIAMALPVIEKIMGIPDLKEALPHRSTRAFREFISEYGTVKK